MGARLGAELLLGLGTAAEIVRPPVEPTLRLVAQEKAGAAANPPTNTPSGDQARFERVREVMVPKACESAIGRGTVGAPALVTLPHTRSPDGGPTGARQPAAAGPSAERKRIHVHLVTAKRGEGTKANPLRAVTQVWTRGRLIAEVAEG